MPAPTRSRIRASGGLELALYEWPGSGRPIVLAHATGFHARCWDQVVAHLPGRHVYAMDMRGHGLSEKPEPPYPWRAFGEDVAAIARELGLQGAIAAGHSMGGHAVTLAAALAPSAFAALLLVDPVILPRDPAQALTFDGEHFAARRRDQWSSPSEMFERFRSRPPFASWDPAVLHDYCDYGLVPDATGEGFVLACPPRVEAAIYIGNRVDGDIYSEIATIDIPVRILRARERDSAAGPDMSGSPAAPDLAAHFRRGEDQLLPQYSHFIPMEDPAFVAAEILALEQRLTE